MNKRSQGLSLFYHIESENKKREEAIRKYERQKKYLATKRAEQEIASKRRPIDSELQM